MKQRIVITLLIILGCTSMIGMQLNSMPTDAVQREQAMCASEEASRVSIVKVVQEIWTPEELEILDHLLYRFNKEIEKDNQ